MKRYLKKKTKIAILLSIFSTATLLSGCEISHAFFVDKHRPHWGDPPRHNSHNSHNDHHGPRGGGGRGGRGGGGGGRHH